MFLPVRITEGVTGGTTVTITSDSTTDQGQVWGGDRGKVSEGERERRDWAVTGAEDGDRGGGGGEGA